MKESKVIGYFSYTIEGQVMCDGDACIIAGSEERMKFYMNKIFGNSQKDIIKKTRLGEVLAGLSQGAAYAFDKESYPRFLQFAKANGIHEGLPSSDTFSEADEQMHFIRVQIV